MKGLIITLTDNCNYGNRLQNYALQEILKRQGLEIESYNNIYIDEKTIKIKRKIAPINIRRVIKSTKSRLFINKKVLKVKKGKKKSRNLQINI